MSRARKIKAAPAIVDTGRYTEQAMWGERTYIPVTADTPALAVCCNVHRNTCIRVSVGRKKTAYIPMEATGLHVVRTPHSAFNHEYTSLLVEYTPQVAAQIYLRSLAATYYISEEARTLLEEISRSGAIKATIQENAIMATPKANKPTTTDAKAKGSKTPPKAAASAKAKKPAAQRYAGKKIKALFKPAEVGAREGSWTHFMIMAALKAPTAEAAQKTVDASKEFVGKKMDFGWLVAKGYVSLS
jgi:hypothetical protein